MNYWEGRKHLDYYRVAMSLVIGESILDVGAGTQSGCQYLLTLPKSVSMRHTIERGPDRGIRLPGVVHHFRDFHRWDVARSYDTVTCMQAVEHVERPAEFSARLFRCASQRVIISIPYRWTTGSDSHRDLDEGTLRLWTGREPIGTDISGDNLLRMVAWYDAASPP